MPEESSAEQDADSFARAADEKRGGFLAEFWDFARHNKRWWLTPIIVILLLVSVLVVLTGTGVGAVLYPLF
jgi:hypothetical protein